MKNIFLLLSLLLAFNTSPFIQSSESTSFNDSTKAQLVTNFAFFTWYRAYLEYLSNTQLNALFAEVIDLRLESEKYAQPAQATHQLQAMSTNLEDIWTRRSAAIAIHNNIMSQLTSSHDSQLNSVIIKFSQETTSKITERAGHYSASIEELFSQFDDKRTQLLTYLNKINDSSNSIKSVHAVQQAEMNRTMMNDIQSGSILLLSYSLPFANIDNALQQEGLAIFADFYANLYQTAVANNYPPETFAILAAEDELAALKFTTLPDPSMLVFN